MRGDCAIGDESPRDNKICISCMNGKCLGIWVMDANLDIKDADIGFSGWRCWFFAKPLDAFLGMSLGLFFWHRSFA